MTPARLFVAVAALVLAAQALAADSASDRAEKQREYFTNTVLLAQDGKEVRFFEDVVKDHVVVISFIYTRCPAACPLLTQKLVKVRAELGGAFGGGVRFVSISVDPERDGPAELRAFARKQGAAVPNWTLLTGKKANVDLVVKKLGQYVEAPEDHSTAFIVGNVRTNHWTKMRPDAPAAIIAQQVKRLAEEDRPAAVAKQN